VILLAKAKDQPYHCRGMYLIKKEIQQCLEIWKEGLAVQKSIQADRVE
jgi:hypothetical protein